MCGITGFIDFTKSTRREHLLGMRDCLEHRGPDDTGEEFLELASCTAGFGFRRLAIIDLSPLGHQPMTNEHTGDVVMLNGEIYNYVEVRKELEGLRHSFRTGSDTEVILRAYQEWGLACVDRFIGMFAIALFDQRKNKVLFIRDRAGVKPLYWYWQDGLFLFGSELKAFHKHPNFRKEIDPDALSLYFQHGYISAPWCIFKNGHKLLPGHHLTVDLQTQEITIQKYWDVTDLYNQPRLDLSYEEAVNTMEETLTSAFRYRLVADVPVGVFLSGGYDSTCVTALLQKGTSQKIKTYTIGFKEEKYNEASYAKAVAEHLGTDHHEYFCTINEALDIVPKLPEIYDEPFGDSSAIPTTLVSREARKHVTVALSADGGDEIFAGYPRHAKFLQYWKTFSRVPGAAGRAAASLLKVIHRSPASLATSDRLDKLIAVLREDNPVSAFHIINQAFTAMEAARLLAPNTRSLSTPFDDNASFLPHVDALGRVLATEYKTYMVDDILQKVDRATMSTGLEGREPFLDQRIIALAARLPNEYKIRNGKGKILLRDIVHRHVPQALVDRPKMGFGVPVERWLREELRDLFESAFPEAGNPVYALLDYQEVAKLKADYLSGKLENFERLWFVISFVLWHKRWMS